MQSKSHLISCLEEIQEKMQLLKAQHSAFGEKLLLAYRGEAQDYQSSKLMPSLFRRPEHTEKEIHLFELFLDYKMIDSHVLTSNIEKAIETQHYVAISRMLDISFNVLASIYFACIGANSEEDRADGFVYVFAFPEHYSPHSRYIEDFYSKILENKHPAYGKNFKVFTHSYLNERIRAQSGGFIFFPGKTFMPISEIYYERVLIDKDKKTELLAELEQLFHIKDVIFFPEKEKIAEEVKKKFYAGSYRERKVSIAEEVDSFCSRVKYETSVLSAQKGASPSLLLRKLRKEKSDILQYISQNETEDASKNELIKKVNLEFNLLKIEFKEPAK